MGAKLILLTGTAIMSLVFGSIGTVVSPPEEQSPGVETAARQNAHVYGVVEAIEGGMLTLATPVGTISLITDANTRLRIPGEEAPSLDDLATGDCVIATGWWEKDNLTFHAFGVAKLTNDAQVFPLSGELIDVGDATLLVKTGRGEAVVHVDANTAYHLRGVAEPDLGDLEAGMRAAIRGTLNTDGSLQAGVVAASQDEPRPRRIQGVILDITSDTFTIRGAVRGAVRGAQGRQVTVLTDTATAFRVPDVENPTIADLKVGDRVACEGTIEGREVRASLVVVLPKGVARLAGEVSAVDDSAIVLDTRGGPVHVLVDGDTVWRIPGVEAAATINGALDNIAVGDHIIAAGTWQDAATFHAVGIHAPDGRHEGQPGQVGGRVIRVDADGLVIGTIDGPVVTHVTDETRIRVPGIEHPSLDDVKAGKMISASGTWNENGELQAHALAVVEDREVRSAPRKP